jgi:Virulence-associated protein E
MPARFYAVEAGAAEYAAQHARTADELVECLTRAFQAVSGGAGTDSILNDDVAMTAALLAQRDTAALKHWTTQIKSVLRQSKVPATAWDRLVAEATRDLYAKCPKGNALMPAQGGVIQRCYEWPDIAANGKAAASVANVKVALERLGITPHADEFANVTMIDGLPGKPAVPHSDDINLQLKADCEALGLRLDKNALWDGVRTIALGDTRHPVRAYLSGLTWDRVPRVGNWLSAYCGAASDPYTQAVGQLFLIGAVRRVRHPGVKHDCMMVLESSEGTGKSSALRALAGADWFSDSVQLGDKAREMVEQTGGKWIVEVAELAGMGHGDVEAIKSQISRAVDVARAAYGRGVSQVPRQFVLAGTTNHGTGSPYLKSRTGNRRFLPVAVGKIDLPKLGADRDQLWAEAAHLEAAGASHGLPQALWAIATAEQVKRLEGDPAEEQLKEYLDGVSGFVSMVDLYKAIGVGGERIGTASAKHGRIVSRVMTAAGWTEARRRLGTGRVRGYENNPDGPQYVFANTMFVRVA